MKANKVNWKANQAMTTSWYLRRGPYASLTNEELLTFIIGSEGVKALYRGVLAPLFSPSHQVPESNPLHAARELLKRALAEQLTHGPVLSSPDAVKDYLRLHFLGQEVESFVVLFLDSRNCLIAAEELSRGTLTHNAVYPREVVRRALSWNAGAVIFSHNHPNGDAAPSAADKALTSRLREALMHVEVNVLDHFVVAGGEAVGFAERGLM